MATKVIVRLTGLPNRHYYVEEVHPKFDRQKGNYS